MLRAVAQRVSEARVEVDGDLVGGIGPGLLVLVGVTHGDEAADAEWLARKLAGLRIFEDDDGRMNLSVRDAGGAVLVVSQFTLYADVSRGRRPSFVGAASPEVAEPLVEHVAATIAGGGVPVETGTFGARMRVSLVNDGPVTIVLDTPGKNPREVGKADPDG